MPAYCGCATAKNRSLWTIWGICMAVFIVSWILWEVMGQKCREHAIDAGAHP